MIKILLVKDHSHTQQLLRTLLELEGYQVLTPTLTDPKKIMSIVQEDHPEIVILDAHLQGYNGLEILINLRKTFFEVQPKVILTSGEDLKPESYKAGADALLLKPFSTDQLLHLIKNLVIP